MTVTALSQSFKHAFLKKHPIKSTWHRRNYKNGNPFLWLPGNRYGQIRGLKECSLKQKEKYSVGGSL
jgi:hypothetical protein